MRNGIDGKCETCRREPCECDPEAPNPGTQEAIDAGCTCPVIDNCHGEGYRHQKGVFIYVRGCPLHDKEK